MLQAMAPIDRLKFFALVALLFLFAGIGPFAVVDHVVKQREDASTYVWGADKFGMCIVNNPQLGYTQIYCPTESTVYQTLRPGKDCILVSRDPTKATELFCLEQ